MDQGAIHDDAIYCFADIDTMTRRGLFMLAAGVVALTVGLANNVAELALFGLTTLLLLIASWLWFAGRLLGLDNHVELEQLVDGRSLLRPIWTDRWHDRHITLRCRSQLGLPLCRLIESPPPIGETTGPLQAVGYCSPGHDLVLQYKYRSLEPGRFRCAGVRLHFTDGLGWFERAVVLRSAAPNSPDLRILPAIRRMKSAGGSKKQTNALPAHGVHRFLKPGSGSELLDLRDYQVGDPPKSIAWKISARRDRLMVREYESEAPIRCTVLVDAADALRWGARGQTPLASAVRLTLSLTELLLGRKDPVGLAVVGSTVTKYLPPAVGSRQLTRLHAELLTALQQPLPPTPCPLSVVMPIIERELAWRHPELMDPWTNPRPAWWKTWLSLTWRWRMLLPTAVALGGLTWMAIAALLQRAVGMRYSISMLVVLILVLLILRRYPWHRQWADRLRMGGSRKQSAAALAVLIGQGPTDAALLQRDDAWFKQCALRWLASLPVAVDRPLFDAQGRDVFADVGRPDRLAKALLRGLMHARDNELFVVIADLLAPATDLAPLVQAVKTAKGRRHDVAIICHWPIGWPAPADVMPSTAPLKNLTTPLDQLIAIERRRRQQALLTTRAQFTKVGVPVWHWSSPETMTMILRRLERLRAAGIAPSRR